MAEKRPLANYGGRIRELAAGDTLPGAGGGAPTPPAGTPPGHVYGIDLLGVPGWIPRDQFRGATLWPTFDDTLPSPVTGWGTVRLDDADEVGQVFFDAYDPHKIKIIETGVYIVSYSVSVYPFSQTSAFARARVFKNGGTIVANLTGRQATFVGISNGGAIDISAIGGMLRLSAGDYLQLLTTVQGSSDSMQPQVYSVARSTSVSIQRVA